MRVKGWNFMEALKILEKDGCEGIAPEAYYNGFYKLIGGILKYYSNESFTEVSLPISTFLGKWKLINIKLRTEKREVFCWLIVETDGSCHITTFKPNDVTWVRSQVFMHKFKYTYTFPPEKEEGEEAELYE